MEKARMEQAAANDPTEKHAAEEKVVQSTIERAPEVAKAKEVEVGVRHEKAERETEHKTVIEAMIKQTEKMSGQQKDEHLRTIASKKAEQQQAIKAIDQRITDAHLKVSSIENEIQAPLKALTDRQEKAAQEMALRAAEHAKAATTATAITDTMSLMDCSSRLSIWRSYPT